MLHNGFLGVTSYKPDLWGVILRRLLQGVSSGPRTTSCVPSLSA